jgi:endonuclease YncB( thermonuclease family)
MAKRKSSKKKNIKLLFLIFAFLISGFFAKEELTKEYAQPVIGVISGKVVKVSDGDTLTIATDENKLVKIRLYGIDSPEKKQNFGDKAQDFLSQQIKDKYVTVDVIDIDQYKRSVGRVFIDDVDINREMVKEGYAWVYTQYCKIPQRAEWERLQETAKEHRKGLWNSNNPIAPWQWRKDSSL